MSGGMVFPLGMPREPANAYGLDAVIYDRVIGVQLSGDDFEQRAVVLTIEANGYLLWMMRRTRDEEGDLYWKQDSVTFLPKGRENALEKAVHAADALRAPA